VHGPHLSPGLSQTPGAIDRLALGTRPARAACGRLAVVYREPTVLRVIFPNPGFFISDTRLEVDLDGARIYEGSATSGFERTVQVAPGPHTLVTRIAVGPILRPKQYTVTIGEAPAYTAVLRYSRFWGNFTRTLNVFEG
jgi:hypothetical protein